MHDGFLVRFTRWDEGFDKEAYYEVENQVPSQPWQVGGEPAGLQWFSIDDDPEETAALPVVGGVRLGCRSRSASRATPRPTAASGCLGAELVPPSRVGLAPLTAQKSNRVAPPGSTVDSATADTGVIR